MPLEGTVLLLLMCVSYIIPRKYLTYNRSLIFIELMLLQKLTISPDVVYKMESHSDPEILFQRAVIIPFPCNQPVFVKGNLLANNMF